MSSKHFLELLDEMKEVHIKKSHDYAQDENPFSNFTYAAEVLKPFKNPIDQVFAGIIGIKLARLAELLSSGKTPSNESIADTFVDLANYSALWGAYYSSLKDYNPELSYVCGICKVSFVKTEYGRVSFKHHMAGHADV